VLCLDVLRALQKEPQARDAVVTELRLARGADRRLDAAIDDAEARLASPDEAGARRLVESLALALQGSLLARYSPAPVSDAFCAARLGGDRGYAFGALPAGIDAGAVLERAWPTDR
jgi:putative acyl-CoA dehydrogenase